jgi:ABC-2 type transport system permease protein
MVGKIFGNLSVGLTQLVFWALTGAGGVALVMWLFPEVGGTGLDFSFLGLMLLTFLPAFVMIAALMAMVGATAGEARDAQQIAAVFSIPIAAPLWFLAILIEQPNHPLAVGLSLFPFTAPATLPLRAVLTNLPAWQIAVSIGLLVLSASGSVWLASRAFRLGMLRYGKSLSLRELLQRGGA